MGKWSFSAGSVHRTPAGCGTDAPSQHLGVYWAVGHLFIITASSAPWGPCGHLMVWHLGRRDGHMGPLLGGDALHA